MHALRATAKGREVAHAFVEKAHGEAYTALERAGVTMRYDSHSENNIPVPEVVDEESVLASLECRVVPGLCVDVGDHTVVIAEVVSVPEQAAGSGSADEEFGLLYAQQSYGKPDVTSIPRRAQDANDED